MKTLKRFLAWLWDLYRRYYKPGKDAAEYYGRHYYVLKRGYLPRDPHRKVAVLFRNARRCRYCKCLIAPLDGSVDDKCPACAERIAGLDSLAFLQQTNKQP